MLITSGDTFTLRHGESLVIQGIPVGTSYTVAETDSRGYTVSARGASGEVTAGNNRVEFVNTKSSIPMTGDRGMPLWTALCLLSAGGMAGVFLLMRRLKKQR